MKHSGIHSTKYNLGHGYKSIIIVIILSIKLEVCTSDENKNCYNFERVKKKTPVNCENMNKRSENNRDRIYVTSRKELPARSQ